MGSLFNKVADLQTCNIFKKRLQHRCFLWILWTFQDQLFYRKPPEAASDSPTIIQWSQLGCFLFDFAPSRAFELELKLTQNVAQIIIYCHVTKQFFLAWIILSSKFDFRICFGGTLVAFDFDEKFTQSVAQITSYITRQKTFFACTLHLINFWTWLGNGRMSCKQKYWIKNTAIKIPILILAFVYFANFLLSLL